MKTEESIGVHFHLELILHPFIHRRWSEQWLLTDNGTVPPCFLRPADSCSNFSEMSHSHHVTSAVFLGAVHMFALVAVFVSIHLLPGRRVVFFLINAWDGTALYCRRCTAKSSCCMFPSQCAPMILQATVCGMTSLV